MNLFWILFIAGVIAICIIIEKAGGYDNEYNFCGFIFTIIGVVVDLLIVVIICSAVEAYIVVIIKPETEHKVENKIIYSIDNSKDVFVLGTEVSNNSIKHYYYVKEEDGTYKTESTTTNKIELNDNEIPQLKAEWDEFKDKRLKFWFIDTNWKRNEDIRFILPTNTMIDSGTERIFTQETIGW